jgi:putative FmdB family regulatory protein
MPTYEYECRKCRHRVEAFQKMSDAPLTECPECGGALKRVFFPIPVHFKGSGFHTTDYAKKAAPPAAKSGEKAGPDQAEGAKSESAESPKPEGARSEGGKSEGGTSEGGKSEGGRSEGGESQGPKTDTGKADGGKSEGNRDAAKG